MTYLSKPSDKYPNSKVFVDWADCAAKDCVQFDRAIAQIVDGCLGIYGILGNGCVFGKEPVAGKKALLLIFRDKKRQWDKTDGKWVDTTVAQEERYFFDRISGDIKDSGLSQFQLAIKPSIPDVFWGLTLQDENSIAMGKILTDDRVVVLPCFASAVPELTDDDLKVLESELQNTAVSAFGNKPKVSTLDVLNDRKKFLFDNLGSYGEGVDTIQELALAIPGYSEEDRATFDRTIEIIRIIMTQ